jgi:hypothetical protein
MPVGAKIRFDLGSTNDVDIRRNIFFGTANKNPDPGVLIGIDVVPQDITVDANGWTQVVSESQTPLNPKGNTAIGDYELTYTAESSFNFAGGGLLIGFQASPPATYFDGGCQQVLVVTDTNDANPSFYARFCDEADLTTDVLDIGSSPDGCYGTGRELGGFILEDLYIEVDIDIKPGSFPNCFNNDGKGVIPIAILGSETFDVNLIDVSTLSLAGLVVRVKGNGAEQCSIQDVSGDFTTPEGAPDGFDDLVCQFVDEDGVWEAGSDYASVEGNLEDGTPFEGQDTICITQ